jgi:hypothetical protein
MGEGTFAKRGVNGGDEGMWLMGFIYIHEIK